jgi:hypothetical protein
MAPSQRRFPRIATEHPAHLIVRSKHAEARVAVLIRAISCEGVGLSLVEEARWRLPVHAPVVVSFVLAGRTMEVPGKVAWFSPVRGSRFDMGIRLTLEVATASTRETYATWIVNAIAAAQQQQQRAGTS